MLKMLKMWLLHYVYTNILKFFINLFLRKLFADICLILFLEMKTSLRMNWKNMLCTLMTRKNMHARSYFFKDLAPPIGFIRAYMLIEFSKLQNMYIKKHWKRLFNTAIITGFNMILLFYFISVVGNDFY